MLIRINKSLFFSFIELTFWERFGYFELTLGAKGYNSFHLIEILSQINYFEWIPYFCLIKFSKIIWLKDENN
jgi:hypothetical protein